MNGEQDVNDFVLESTFYSNNIRDKNKCLLLKYSLKVDTLLLLQNISRYFVTADCRDRRASKNSEKLYVLLLKYEIMHDADHGKVSGNTEQRGIHSKELRE